MPPVPRIFGSVFPRKTTIETEIDRLYGEVRSFEPVKELIEHKGWKKVEGVLIRFIGRLDDEIVSYCDEPEKNADILRQLYALREAYVGVIGIVHAPSEKMDAIRRRLELMLKTRERTTGMPRPSEGDNRGDQPS